MRTIYVIFVKHCMKWRLLSVFKGSNYYRSVEKSYNFRIKSGTGNSSIVSIYSKMIFLVI